jgi:hypothetical protein
MSREPAHPGLGHLAASTNGLGTAGSAIEENGTLWVNPTLSGDQDKQIMPTGMGHASLLCRDAQQSRSIQSRD